MKKKLSCLVALGLTATMAVSCVGCGNANTVDNSNKENTSANGNADSNDNKIDDDALEAYKIAVAIPQYNSNNTMFKNYLEKYVSEDFNVEFIFSEALNQDIANEMQFMENAKNSGAQGYITFNATNQEGVSSIVAAANDLGLFTATNSEMIDDIAELPYYTGSVSASTEEGLNLVAEQFNELTNILVGDGEKHNVVICSMGASNGSEQHIRSTEAALNALKAEYNLTYDADPAELATAASVTEISTGTDVKITIIPGVQVTEDVEQVLKGGEYDTIICVGPQYAWFESVIASTEKALDMDIKTCSIVGIDDATKTSFETLDVKGNSSLNCALVKNSSLAAELFALVYNGLTGNSDTLKENGKAKAYTNLMWVCDNAETYAKICTIDSSKEYACFTTDELKQMIKVFNDNLTPESFESICEAATSENIIANRGLNK